jgi:putative FmdB family regulatory protein
MPFYEYECTSCKFYVEVMQKISDAPLRKCTSCGKNTLKKLISAPVFRLKGSGWYETDFKSDKENKRNLAGDREESESKTEAKSDGAGAGSTESSKPAASSKPVKTSAPAVRTRKSAAAAKKPAARRPPAKKKAASRARSRARR